MLGKTGVKLILLITAVNIVFSCLVTNCPRGGKREDEGFSVLPNKILHSGIKMCKSCNPGKEICLGVYCSSDVSCGGGKQCVSQEICCSKRFCKVHESCQSDLQLRKRKEFNRSSMFLTKILKYNL